MPDPMAVKHEVSDDIAKERTHPVFDPLLEQFEVYTQTIQRLRQRQVLLKLPEHDRVLRVRIPKVSAPRAGAAHLERWKQWLAQAVGEPCRRLEEGIEQRAQRCGVPFHLPGSDPVATAQPAAAPRESHDAFWQ